MRGPPRDQNTGTSLSLSLSRACRRGRGACSAPGSSLACSLRALRGCRRFGLRPLKTPSQADRPGRQEPLPGQAVLPLCLEKHPSPRPRPVSSTEQERGVCWTRKVSQDADPVAGLGHTGGLSKGTVSVTSQPLAGLPNRVRSGARGSASLNSGGREPVSSRLLSSQAPGATGRPGAHSAGAAPGLHGAERGLAHPELRVKSEGEGSQP